MTKFLFSKLKKNCFAQAISYPEFTNKRANSVDLDEVVHHEPPHQDLCCLQILLFSSLALNLAVDGVDAVKSNNDFNTNYDDTSNIPPFHLSSQIHLQLISARIPQNAVSSLTAHCHKTEPPYLFIYKMGFFLSLE